MPFELQQLYVDVEARLKTSPLPKSVGTADDFKDAMTRVGALPAVYQLYKGSKSKGRLVQNSRRQMRDPLKIFLAIVAESLMNKAEAHIAMAGILQPIEDLIVGWNPGYLQRAFVFDGDYFVMRGGGKVVYGAEFRSAAIDFTT